MVGHVETGDGHSSQRLIALLVTHLKEKHGYTDEAITGLLAKAGNPRRDDIPLGIFVASLSPFETITRYLVDVRGMKVREIAERTNRSVSTIWTTYRNAKRKYPNPPSIADTSSITLPLSLFSDRTFSPLESITIHLKERLRLGFHDIALLLHRDDSTIWTVYDRAKKKRSGQVRG